MPEKTSARVYLQIGAAAVLVHVVVGILRTYDAWFFNDDFQNLAMAAEGHKPLSHMLQSVFGQFVLFYRATNLVFFHIFGLNFVPFVTFLLACSATAVGCLMWLCARVRLPPVATAVVGAFLAFTWLPFEGQSWWSAGLHILPGAAALCACLALAARPKLSLGLGHSLALAAIYAIGINYYNAVLLVIGPVAAIRWYVRLQERPETPFLKRIAGVLADLAPALVMAALAIAAISWLDGDKTSLTDPVSIAGSVGLGAVYGLGAGIGGMRGFDLDTPTRDLGFWGIVGLTIVVGTTLVSILRSPRTAWLWAGCWTFILLQLWIIGGERIPSFGQWVTASPRYNLSNVLMFVATACIAFGQRYPCRILLAPGPVRTAIAWMGGVASAAVVAMHIVVGASYTAPAAQQARAFVHRLAETAPAGVTRIGNRTLPSSVTQHWTGGYATLERFRLIAPAHLQISPLTAATHFLADDGSVLPIAGQPVEHWTLPGGRTIEPRVLPAFEAVGEVAALQRSRVSTAAGWINPLLHAGSPASAVAVTPEGLVYTGLTGLPSADLKPRFRMPIVFDNAGFEIDLLADAQVEKMRFFLLLGEVLAIPIPQLPHLSDTAALIPTASRTAIGAPLTIAGVELSQAFSERGWFQNGPAPPLPGRGFGSYVALGNAGQGDVTVTLDLPAGVSAIAFPLLTGPAAKGIRFSVIDPATGETIAALADTPPLEAWRLWAVDLPPGFTATQIKVRAEDNTAEWGGWAAIGPVHALKPAAN